MTGRGRSPFLPGSLALALTGSSLLLVGTPQPVAAAPIAPALVEAQGLNGTTIELLWTSVPGATGYNVYRDGNPVALASTAGTRFADTSVAPLSTHTYEVTALAGSESATSAPASASAQAAPDTSPPSTPGGITASSLTSSSVKLGWGSSTDNVGIEGYRVSRGLSPTTLVDIWTTDAVTNYTATNLRAGTTYWFGVQALDAANNISAMRTISITTKTSINTTPPAAPSNLTTRVFSSSRIDMYWSASSSTDVSGYQVLRNGSVVGRIDLPSRLTFSDNGLSASTSYSYAIQAVDSAGNVSAKGPSRIVSTLAPGAVIVARGPYTQWVTATSARVVWWTNLQTPAVVSCGACPQTSYSDPTLAYEHVMLISGLDAGTSYAYSVGNGTASAPGTFSTAAPPGATFSFAAIGDFGGGSSGEFGNASQISADGTSFIQTLGDNVYPEAADPSFSATYSDFDARFFRPFGAAFAKKALWAANGNKEYYGNGAWFTHMWLPNNERWYSYDWGDAHILVLDTEQPYQPGSPQFAFAQADLAANQSAAWRIVAIQRPAYSSTSANSSSDPVRASLVSLFEAEKVQLVLSGNSHNYERTHPLLSNGNPNSPVVSASGVTYVVAGNGGNGFNPFTIPQPYWSAFRQASTYGYLQVTVSPGSLVVKELSSAGTLLDSTLITGNTQAPGAISGQVTDANTTAPIVGAQVSYPGGSTATASDGTYTLSNVPPGSYSVTASAQGYVPLTHTVTVNSGQASTSAFALAPAPPSVVFSDGFESGNLSNWTTSGGLTVESTRVHAGTFAAEGNTTTGATYAKKLLPSTYTSGYLRAYVYLASASSQVNLLRFRTAADVSLGSVFVTAVGQLGLRDDVSAQTFTSATTMTLNAWHSLEVHFSVGASGSIQVWLDGNPVTDLSETVNLGSVNIGKAQIGDVTSGRAYDVIFDDVVFNTSPIGP